MWHKVLHKELPETYSDPYGPESSKPVLAVVYRKEIKVVTMQRWEPDDEWEWFTNCSERWNITGQVTHWMELPPLPDE